MRIRATILAFLLLASLPARAVVSKGDHVPDFAVEGAAGEVMHLADLAGRYVLIVYEDRASANQNVGLKQRLWDLHRRGRLDDRMAVLPIADVRAFKEWPASQYARKAVAAERKRTGRLLYADFTGAAGRAIAAKPGHSTLAFLDPDGEVLWSGEGPVVKADQNRLLRMVLARAGRPEPARPRKPREPGQADEAKAAPGDRDASEAAPQTEEAKPAAEPSTEPTAGDETASEAESGPEVAPRPEPEPEPEATPEAAPGPAPEPANAPVPAPDVDAAPNPEPPPAPTPGT